MSSATDICNLALLHLKSALRIGNIATDTSEVGQICRIVYPIVRDKFQGDRPWTFCKKVDVLVPLETNPTLVWAFSYVYPPDCLFLRRIQPMVSNPGSQTEVVPSSALANFGAMTAPQQDTEQSVIPFEVYGGAVYTNMPSAVAEYTMRNEDEGTWPAPVVLAMSYEIAAELAPALTDGDPFQLIEKMQALARQKSDHAAASNANERVVVQRLSEFTRMR